MTRPTARTIVRERTHTDPLAGIEVADDPYAVFAENPYAVFANPYAALATDSYASLGDPYAALAENPYAPGNPDAAGKDLAQKQKHRRPAPRRIVKRTIVILPGGRQPSMLWTPATEFERCYEEYWEWQLSWGKGDTVDFSEAAESYFQLSGWPGHEDDEYYVGSCPVDSETETFEASDLPVERVSPLWDDLVRAVAELRAKLIADPTPIADMWSANMHNTLGKWVDDHVPIGVDGLMTAIAEGPMNGVGGATLDYCCWWEPEEFGRLGQEIREYIEGIEEDEYVWIRPIDNFILDPANLHPDSKNEEKSWYNLWGQYVVDRVAYHSDPKGQGVTGFRSVFLRPTGEPVRPDFSE